MIKDPHKGQEVYWITEHVDYKRGPYYTSSVQKTRIIRHHVLHTEQWCMILIGNDDYPLNDLENRSPKYQPKRWLTSTHLYATEGEASVALLKRMIK